MATDIQIIIQACKTIISLKNLLESGDLSGMMAGVELEAAKDAPRKSRLAKNPQLQVMSAVNHLESAHRHCLKGLEKCL